MIRRDLRTGRDTRVFPVHLGKRHTSPDRSPMPGRGEVPEAALPCGLDRGLGWPPDSRDPGGVCRRVRGYPVGPGAAGPKFARRAQVHDVRGEPVLSLAHKDLLSDLRQGPSPTVNDADLASPRLKPQVRRPHGDPGAALPRGPQAEAALAVEGQFADINASGPPSRPSRTCGKKISDASEAVRVSVPPRAPGSPAGCVPEPAPQAASAATASSASAAPSALSGSWWLSAPDSCPCVRDPGRVYRGLDAVRAVPAACTPGG